MRTFDVKITFIIIAVFVIYSYIFWITFYYCRKLRIYNFTTPQKLAFIFFFFYCFVRCDRIRCFHFFAELRTVLAFRSTHHATKSKVFSSANFPFGFFCICMCIESFQAWIIYYFLACANLYFHSIVIYYCFDYRKSCVFISGTSLIVYVPGQFVTFSYD